MRLQIVTDAGAVAATVDLGQYDVGRLIAAANLLDELRGGIERAAAPPAAAPAPAPAAPPEEGRAWGELSEAERQDILRCLSKGRPARKATS